MRKKLFAVIMSVMMMVTFMPTMAFADSCSSNHANASVKFVSWNADYSKANFKVVCDECEKQLASFSVETKRLFDATYENASGVSVNPTSPIKKIGVSSLTSPVDTNTGAIFTFVKEDKIDDAATAALLEEGYQFTQSGNPGYIATVNAPTFKYAYDADNDNTLDANEEVLLTVYYNFTNAKVCNSNAKAYSEMGGDKYLDLAYLCNYSDCDVALEEPSNVDSFNNKPHYALAHLDRWTNDKKPYYAGQMQDVEEIFAGDKHNHNTADRDVRLDLDAPQYAPYEDDVTVNMTLKFQKFADVEGIIVGGDVTQAVKILSGANDITLGHYIYKVKGEALPETSASASGDAKKLDIRAFKKLWDNESEAKRAASTDRTTFSSLTYIGEDVNFEIATKGVTVQYGAIDAVGNVTWSNESPVIKDIKMNPEGFYGDEDYHFLVKVTKGSKTRYAHMVVQLAPADLMYGFAYTDLYVGVGQKLVKKELLGMKVANGTKFVNVYGEDKAVADSIIDKYMDIDAFDQINTNIKGVKDIYVTFDSTTLNKDKKADEKLAQFLANYSLSDFHDDATLHITDQYNNIKASNKIKTYHIKNAAKLKKTKTFKLKATADYGKVTFKKISAKYSKIKVASNGKVTVKKGLKKGTYKVKVQISAPCKSVKRTVTIKIKK